jgi:hypothetical protein
MAGARVAVTTATTPFPMAAAFIPDATQTTVPDPELQFSVSPAAVSAELAVVLSDVMAAVVSGGT